MAKKRTFLRSNERTDVITSVRLVERLLPDIPRDPQLWKWVIIAAHNALQGAIVCAISGTDGTGAFSKNAQTQWRDWFDETRSAPPSDFPADFSELVRRASGTCWELTPDDRKKIERLNELRKSFTHYTPKGWSVFLSYLPPAVEVALDGVEHLMALPQVRMHLSRNEIRKLKVALEGARDELPKRKPG